MKIKIRQLIKFFIFLFAFVGLSAIGSDKSPAQADGGQARFSSCFYSSREEYMEFLDDLLKLKYDFRISGEIVDPDGNLVPGVMVLSSKSKGPMSGSFDRKKFLISNGRFSFDSKGVFSWGLTFSKDGYYEAKTATGITYIEDAAWSGDKSYSKEGRLITRKVKVVMYPHGDFGDMIEINKNLLTFSEEGDVKKIECVIIPYEFKYVTPEGRKRTRRWEEKELQFTFTREDQLPRNLIYIVPGRNKDGSHDGTIRLKTSGKNSGFLQMEYKEGVYFFRSMWEAPEKGDYQPELIIEDGLTNYLQHNYVKPKTVGNMHSVRVSKLLVPKVIPYPTVFYFRVNGYYGKGMIFVGSSYGSKLEKNQAALWVYLYINRNPGVRNTNRWLGTDW